ncbi:hypothetical protein HDU84_009786 [Entophlyctis sp. JEL0112]|nr:hypothetical protein HDU84_009786 [Entophlyctis sp. JEL0112]
MRLSTAPSPSSAAQKPPPVPLAPGPEDCCMSGCAHCVWDVYAAEIDIYNDYAREHGLALLSEEAKIDPSVQAFRDMERSILQRKN